ncbi:hypothetical protein ABPG75_006461 [Micractinium tetrahymenae]
MAQPAPTGTQAGWGGPAADTGMTGEEMAADWGQADAAVQPRLVDPAGAAPKAFIAGAEEEAGVQPALGIAAEGGSRDDANEAAERGLPFTDEAVELLRQVAEIEAAGRAAGSGGA